MEIELSIDPITGRALAWNPTRTRGEGVRAFAVCPRGLLVGSDTDQLGHEHHARIGLFPEQTARTLAACEWLAGGALIQSTDISYPRPPSAVLTLPRELYVGRVRIAPIDSR